MGDKRKLKVQKFKQRKAKEAAAKSSQRFINPRDVKGVRGFEERKGTLGEEFFRRAKTGGIVDKREGGDGADEDQMLGRMRKVREWKADKFNLSDTAAGSQGYSGLGNALGESTGMKPLLEEDGPIDENRKKTKDEILQEIIEKNRSHREEKKLATAERDRELKELDKDFKAIASMLEHRRSEKTKLPSSVSVSKVDSDGNAMKKSRVMTLGSDGVAQVVTDAKPEPASKEVRKQMEKILKQVQRENKAEVEAKDEEEKAAVVDDYDRLMLDLETSATAKAGSRTKSNAEVAAEAQATLMRLQREKARRMKGSGEDSDDEEDGQGLYQLKFKANDTQEKKDMRARKQASSLLEAYMQELEAECKPDEESGNINCDFERVDRVVEQLKTLADVSSMAAAHTTRGLIEVLNELLQAEVGAAETDESLIELGAAEKAAATPFALLLPAIFSKIFPPSDFKHPVCTPMALYLASALVRVPITNLRDIAVGLYRASILLDLSVETHRYCGEVVAYVTNVLSLAAVSPAPASGQKRKADAALVDEGRANLLLSDSVPAFAKAPSLLAMESEGASKLKKKHLAGAPLKFAAMFCTADQKVTDSAATRHALACAAYKLAVRVVDVYGKGQWSEFLDPAFAPLQETLASVEAAEGNWLGTSKTIKSLHDTLMADVTAARARSRDNRIPLRLQAHRPIPLPLYNCKVTEWEEGEEDEKRALKKEYKAEKKQVIRALRQDTRYLMQAKEEEKKIDDDRRESTLKGLMTELQEQRQMIKESDVAKGKLKSIQKRKAGGKS
eukprot:TRINITY_DN973_c0_g1_i1.p1 TRINITY_DN973_c0_g1~~TRINITY_DN973_c0_g1_i1.p1  ORF type:complete len:788 (+),score=381.66 TRINITY_DN973_c0_g1_i1:45-2408(+)